MGDSHTGCDPILIALLHGLRLSLSLSFIVTPSLPTPREGWGGAVDNSLHSLHLSSVSEEKEYGNIESGLFIRSTSFPESSDLSFSSCGQNSLSNVANVCVRTEKSPCQLSVNFFYSKSSRKNPIWKLKTSSWFWPISNPLASALATVYLIRGQKLISGFDGNLWLVYEWIFKSTKKIRPRVLSKWNKFKKIEGINSMVDDEGMRVVFESSSQLQSTSSSLISLLLLFARTALRHETHGQNTREINGEIPARVDISLSQ